MNQEIRLWEVNETLKDAQEVPATKRFETERSLEEVLVKNPEMLMTGITLVARQAPTDTGYLDLLGIDEEGRLVVFELKREKLTRDAVAQVIDYCSYLDSLSEGELADYLLANSGTHGTEKIQDLESWYQERRDAELSSLRPARMALVGIGADGAALRMVEFLAQSGVDIALLTFHGYEHQDKVILARLDEGTEIRKGRTSSRVSSAERRKKISKQAEDLDMAVFWDDAVKVLNVTPDCRPTQSGFTFRVHRFLLPDNVVARGTHSVVMQPERTIRITFYPAAVHLCHERFEQLKDTLTFKLESPPNAPTTSLIGEQWYCVLNEDQWKNHRAVIAELVRAVREEWLAIQQTGAEVN